MGSQDGVSGIARTVNELITEVVMRSSPKATSLLNRANHTAPEQLLVLR